MMDIASFFQGETARIVIACLIFAAVVVVVIRLYHYIVRRVLRHVARTKNRTDDWVTEVLKVPFLWLLLWILFKIFSYGFLDNTRMFNALMDISNVLLILTLGWILIKLTRVVFHYMEQKFDVSAEDNYKARGSLTKLKIFEGIVIGLIALIVVAVCLLTFDKVRTVGWSLLTSAGIAGVILGFAAQQSLGMVLAGIQIAITQPIRLDDVVVVEGEWGRVEEIKLTYVVVKIWDERRLVLPVSYFLQKPFQNWTRTTADILGTVFLYVDYMLPLDRLREKLDEAVKSHPLWDRRVANVQVTDMKTNYMELRVLLSTRNSATNWQLRVDIREELVRFISAEYPDCFVKTRVSGEAEETEDILRAYTPVQPSGERPAPAEMAKPGEISGEKA